MSESRTIAVVSTELATARVRLDALILERARLSASGAVFMRLVPSYSGGWAGILVRVLEDNRESQKVVCAAFMADNPGREATIGKAWEGRRYNYRRDSLESVVAGKQYARTRMGGLEWSLGHPARNGSDDNA